MADRYILGIDMGTGGARVGIFDLNGKTIHFAGEPFTLLTPNPAWAEQDVDEWWSSLCIASKRCVQESGVNPADIIGIGHDATSCTVVLMDDKMNVLRPSMMWCDVRASDQAIRITATKDPALKYNGYGNASAEWMPSKMLWVKENEPDIYSKATTVFEQGDWMTWKLTGKLTTSLNTASIHWYYDDENGGFPRDFYAKVGIEEVLDRFPKDIFPIGHHVGGLTKEAAAAMGLVEGTPVAQGGADAMIGMLGLNVVRPGNVALITGSSHVILALSETQYHGQGINGSYPNAQLPGMHLVFGAQVSTGSVVNWFKNNLAGFAAQRAKEQGCSAYDVLNREAEKIALGSDGLVTLDFFQGSRTPYNDSLLRGLISGLTLAHTEAHVYRALLEGVCYGTENIMRYFRKANLMPDKFVVCGGATNSKLWMQIHSDVSGIPVSIPACTDAPAFGSAMLGAVAAGAFPDLVAASDKMVEFVDEIQPNMENHYAYQYFVDRYVETHDINEELQHNMAIHERDKK